MSGNRVFAIIATVIFAVVAVLNRDVLAAGLAFLAAAHI